MIRTVALVGLLMLAAAACGSKQSSGPAWPKSAGRVDVDPEKDGGESLEPQQAVSVAAIEHSDDKTPAVDDDAIVVEEPAGDAKPDSATTSPPPGDVHLDVIEVRPDDSTAEP
jgi:hypothetical protein